MVTKQWSRRITLEVFSIDARAYWYQMFLAG